MSSKHTPPRVGAEPAADLLAPNCRATASNALLLPIIEGFYSECERKS
jgi:hypothetical protein